MATVVRIKHRRGESEEEYQARKVEAQAAKASVPEPDHEPNDGAPREKKQRTPRGGSRKQEIASLLAIPNTILLMFPHTREDALNPDEAEQLTTALDHYQQKDERFRRLLVRITQASTFAELLSIGLVIAIPRLIRHGFLPRSLGQHLANLAAENADMPFPPYVPTGPGPTPEIHPEAGPELNHEQPLAPNPWGASMAYSMEESA